MAMTNESVGKILEPFGFELETDGDYFWTWAKGSTVYRDKDGDLTMFVVVQLGDKGRFLRVMAPQLYDLSACANRSAPMEVALAVGYRTKSLCYEFEPSTCELRATLEYPLGSGTFTEQQLLRCLRLMIGIVDEADPVMRHAIRTGEINWDLYGKAPPDPSKQEMDALIEKAGGIEGLRKLAEQAAKQGNGKQG
jgi:hypothetical protein